MSRETQDASPDAVEAFISRWEKAGGAERANYQIFLTELCGPERHRMHHKSYDRGYRDPSTDRLEAEPMPL